MAFFFNDVKKKPPPKKGGGATKRGGYIPIETLNRLGCEVCELDHSKDPRSPKMKPSGTDSPLLYLLGSAPSIEEDDSNLHFTDQAGEEVVRLIGRRFFDKNVRSNFTVQCLPPVEGSGKKAKAIDPTVQVIECCRGRVEQDISRTKPLVVVGVGDDVLNWAVPGNDKRISALRLRGRLFPIKVGSHVCWYYPVISPNYVYGKSRNYGPNKWELCLQHDLRRIVQLLEDEALPAPEFHSGGYDLGIEHITGQEAGDLERLQQALDELSALPNTSIDIETNGLRVWKLKDPKIWMVAIGTYERTVVFPVDHPEGWGTEARRKKVWSMLGWFLLHSGKKIAHNLAFELEWFLHFFGDRVVRLTDWGDTMAMAYVYDEREGTKSLDLQTRMFFGFWLKAQSRVDPVRLLEYPLRDTLRYNGMDTKWTHRLYSRYARLFDQEPYYWNLYERRVETIRTLTLLEARGLPIDFKHADDIERRLLADLEAVETKVQRCPEVQTFTRSIGRFSVTNNDHVLTLMRDICKRAEVLREDRDGSKETTDEEALAAIPSSEVPSASLILEHRGLAKLHSTYIDPLMSGDIVAVDGRMHSKYSCLKTVTTRLASEDPNAQNWPKRKFVYVRGVVAAPEGFLLMACDYGQIEFRVVGMASEDPEIVQACWTGYDVHKFWAERLVAIYPQVKDWVVTEFGVDWDEKGIKTLRQEAKNKWVFPQLFGSSVKGCATNLHLPLEVAEELAGEFWSTFKATKRWQEKLLKSYEKKLYVETLGGYRRRGAMTKNEVINMPIQGTACEIVLEGMNALSELSFELDDPWLHPILNVHDDLTSLQPVDGLERRTALITQEMCRPRFDYINVPLIVEVSTGHRWHELKEIGKFSSEHLFNQRNPYK